MANNNSNTRYHTTSFAPPDLERVCRELARAWKKHGAFTSQGNVRSVIGHASPEYEGERGRSDELVRFLFNEGVLLAVEGRKDCTVFDVERSSVVLLACSQKIATPPLSDSEKLERAKELEEERTSSRRQSVSEEDALAAAIRNAPPLHITTVSAKGQEHLNPAHALVTEADRVSREEVNIEEGEAVVIQTFDLSAYYEEKFKEVCKEFRSRVPQEASFSLWLTPLEDDVWTTLLAGEQEVDGELRVGIPRSQDARLGLRGAGVRHYGDHDYQQVFERFVESGIVECIGENATGNLPYRFVIHPSRFFVQRIPTRGVESLPTKIVEHVRLLQQKAVEARGAWRPMAEEVASVLDLEPDDIGYRRADGNISLRPVSWRGGHHERRVLAKHMVPESSCSVLALFYDLSGEEDPSRGCLVPYPGFEPHRVYDRITAPRIAATLYSPTGDPEMSLGLSLGGFPWSEHGRIYSPYNNEGMLVDAFTHPEELTELSDKALQHFTAIIDDLERHLPHWKERLRREYESREAEKERRRRRAEERRTLNSQLAAKRAEIEALQSEVKALEDRERTLGGPELRE